MSCIRLYIKIDYESEEEKWVSVVSGNLKVDKIHIGHGFKQVFLLFLQESILGFIINKISKHKKEFN